MQQWKERTVNRRSLAAPFSIGISSSHIRVGLCITEAKEWETGDSLYRDNGEYNWYDACRWWFLIATTDSTCRSVFRKPRRKRLFSVFSFLQFLYGYTLTLLRETFVQAFYLSYRADFFTGDVTNSGLHTALYTFSIRGIPDV